MLPSFAVKLLGDHWSRGDLIALVGLLVAIVGIAATWPRKSVNPNGKPFEGKWSATIPEYTEDFGPSDPGPFLCRYTLHLSSIHAQIVVDSGEVQSSAVSYFYSENPIQEPGKSCTSGVPDNSENRFSLAYRDFINNSIHLEFTGITTTRPLASAKFDGELNDRISPPEIRGVLRIVRSDQPAKFAGYNWDVKTPMILRKEP